MQFVPFSDLVHCCLFCLFFLQPEEVCLCVQAANKGSTMSSICRPSTPTGTLFVSGTLSSNNSRTSCGGRNTLQCIASDSHAFCCCKVAALLLSRSLVKGTHLKPWLSRPKQKMCRKVTSFESWRLAFKVFVETAEIQIGHNWFNAKFVVDLFFFSQFDQWMSSAS